MAAEEGDSKDSHLVQCIPSHIVSTPSRKADSHHGQQVPRQMSVEHLRSVMSQHRSLGLPRHTHSDFSTGKV